MESNCFDLFNWVTQEWFQGNKICELVFLRIVTNLIHDSTIYRTMTCCDSPVRQNQCVGSWINTYVNSSWPMKFHSLTIKIIHSRVIYTSLIYSYFDDAASYRVGVWVDPGSAVNHDGRGLQGNRSLAASRCHVSQCWWFVHSERNTVSGTTRRWGLFFVSI